VKKFLVSYSRTNTKMMPLDDSLRVSSLFLLMWVAPPTRVNELAWRDRREGLRLDSLQSPIGSPRPDWSPLYRHALSDSSTQ
jgi:hypothetical protein